MREGVGEGEDVGEEEGEDVREDSGEDEGEDGGEDGGEDVGEDGGEGVREGMGEGGDGARAWMCPQYTTHTRRCTQTETAVSHSCIGGSLCYQSRMHRCTTLT